MNPSLGGSYIFGAAVHVEMSTNPNAAQIAAFFGVSGVQSLDGGARGRVFMVSGVLTGNFPSDVVAAGLIIESFGDGVARTLIDTAGFPWPNVVYRKEFQWTETFMLNCSYGGWLRPYRCMLHGLT